MFRRIVICLPLTVFLLTVSSANAQQTSKVPRIGYLDNSTASGSAVLVDAFRQEMTKLGWIEGKNIAIEYRFSELKAERLPELAADLVRLNVDLIVTTGEPPARAAKSATTTIPIVMANAGDPVGSGFVASLGAAGRQCHRAVEFSSGAEYQKARDTQRHSPQARPSWTSAAAGRQHNIRPPT